MRKLVLLLICMVFISGNCAVAFAAEGDNDGTDAIRIESLTPAERSLVAHHPVQAFIAELCRRITDRMLAERFPGSVDGDRGNAFRHAFWSASMTRWMGPDMAKAFTDAHEKLANDDGSLKTDEELAAMSWSGFTGLEHREMDLANNAAGRECVKPGEFFVTFRMLADRVMEKLENGELTVLVKPLE